jgi:hypothetical protein
MAFLNKDGNVFTSARDDGTGKPVTDVTIKGSLASFKTAALSITSTPVELTAGVVGKKQLIVYPPEAGTIYWGGSSTVTSANGAPLKAGDLPVEFSFANDTVKVYAVSDGTNRSVRVVESK